MSDITTRLVVDARIIAHASPRWRAAQSEQERVAKNKVLSEGRAAVIKGFITEKLREALKGSDVKFQYDLSYPDHSTIPDQTVVVGSEGRGQSETIVAARGDRRNNDPNFLRADIRIRIAHALQEVVPRRVVRKYTQPTRTRDWYVSVGFSATAAMVASATYLIVQLENMYGQTAIGHAAVGGAGVGFTGIPKNMDKVVGAGVSFSDATSFYTKYPVEFGDFDGIGIRYSAAGIAVFGGYEFAWLTFYGLGSGAAAINVSGASLGGQLGVSASIGNGVMWLEKVPPDYIIESYGMTEFDRYKSEWIVDEATSVYFGTESSTLLPDSAKELERFAIKVAGNLKSH